MTNEKDDNLSGDEPSTSTPASESNASEKNDVNDEVEPDTTPPSSQQSAPIDDEAVDDSVPENGNGDNGKENDNDNNSHPSTSQPSSPDPDSTSGLPASVLAIALKEAKAEIERLTSERDAAISLVDANTLENESLLGEIQSSLQTQMSARAEAEASLRKIGVERDELLGKAEELRKLEGEFDDLSREKSRLEAELGKIREAKDEADQQITLYASRLNDAKKKEAQMTREASLHSTENSHLKKETLEAEAEIERLASDKTRLERQLEKLKTKCVDKVKTVEARLEEERTLNDERKAKMKTFVQNKAEELRAAKTRNEELAADLEDARAKVRDARERLETNKIALEGKDSLIEQMQAQIASLKKNSDQLHKIGDSLENELNKTAKETEEHKNKRLTAKHELMTILRKLEAEQAVGKKLRDCLKFTFTPKALSQQQLLQESIVNLETELMTLARQMGKMLPERPLDVVACMNGEKFGDEPAAGGGVITNDEGIISPSSSVDDAAGAGAAGVLLDNNQRHDDNPDNNIHTLSPRPALISGRQSSYTNKSHNNLNDASIISNLENETQRVSQGIMALMSCVERLHYIVADPGERTCVSAFADLLTGSKQHREHPRRGEEEEEEDGGLSGGDVRGSGGIPVVNGGRKKDRKKYGSVPGG